MTSYATRDQLVMENMALVRPIAAGIRRKLPPSVETDDLIAAGVLGLIDAAAKCDLGRPVASFRFYARHRIRGAILDSLRGLDWASRDHREAQKRINREIHTVRLQLQREPSAEDMAAHLNMNVVEWQRSIAENRHIAEIPLDGKGGQPFAALANMYPSPDEPADQRHARGELRAAIAHAIARLPRRLARILTLYYTKEMTMPQIAEMMGVRQSRISQLHKRALELVRVEFREQGIGDSDAFRLTPFRAVARTVPVNL